QVSLEVASHRIEYARAGCDTRQRRIAHILEHEIAALDRAHAADRQAFELRRNATPDAELHVLPPNIEARCDELVDRNIETGRVRDIDDQADRRIAVRYAGQECVDANPREDADPWIVMHV